MVCFRRYSWFSLEKNILGSRKPFSFINLAIFITREVIIERMREKLLLLFCLKGKRRWWGILGDDNSTIY